MYDYIYRAMPFGEAQSLTQNETYQIVAYLLSMNDIIDEEDELNHNNICLLYTSPSPRDGLLSRMPSSA